ncbi:hypothetical protein Tco_1460237 [Tanacetum coccineum]
MKSLLFTKNQTKLSNEAWECFKGLLRQCPHHGFSELHQLDTFYNSLSTNDQDALDSAAGGNFLDKMPREGLAIIESKSKIHQMAALLEDKMNNRMSSFRASESEKNATTPATVKAVEEVCVTCGSNHNFNNCPLTRNDFPVFHDNIHQFQQTAAVGNFVQRNPPNLANQIKRPTPEQDDYQKRSQFYAKLTQAEGPRCGSKVGSRSGSCRTGEMHGRDDRDFASRRLWGGERSRNVMRDEGERGSAGVWVGRQCAMITLDDEGSQMCCGANSTTGGSASSRWVR